MSSNQSISWEVSEDLTEQSSWLTVELYLYTVAVTHTLMRTEAAENMALYCKMVRSARYFFIIMKTGLFSNYGLSLLDLAGVD